MLLLFSPVGSRWRECVAAAKNLCRREKGCLKTAYYRKYACCNRLQTQD